MQDVAPVLSKLGCNAGTCHGAAQGKNGFKLSLRGYDPLCDVRALTDDLAARRVNPASPDRQPDAAESLGRRAARGRPVVTPRDEAYYEILRDWIRHGGHARTRPRRGWPASSSFPQNPVVPRIGGKQQVRVVATYADGRTRDVTRRGVHRKQQHRSRHRLEAAA